jgi:hypothetical protein
MISKHFKAIDYKPHYQNTSTFKITAGGMLDKSTGVIITMFQFTFRVSADSNPDEPDDGTMDELRQLYFLNNPNGSPSDLLTLVDFYGKTYSVKFKEDMVPSPLTTQLEGPNAWHIVPVELIVVPETVGS